MTKRIPDLKPPTPGVIVTRLEGGFLRTGNAGHHDTVQEWLYCNEPIRVRGHAEDLTPREIAAYFMNLYGKDVVDD